MAALREFSDAATLIASLTQHVAQRLKEDLAQQEQAVLVVSGGRSPVPLFQSLSNQILVWSRVLITLADERWVPPDHEDSNEALVRQHLIKGRAATAQFQPLWTGRTTPEAAVPRLCEAFDALARPFSQVILGMGEDGHIASLFPDAAQLADGLITQAAVLAVHPTRAAYARMSQSLQSLLNTRDIVLMISGAEKKAILERALGEGPVEDLPVRAILRQTVVPDSVFWAP